MLKNLIYSLIIGLSISSYTGAQPANLISLFQTQKLYQGNIGGDPIELYLELSAYAPENDQIYSVNGWYRKKSNNQKIQLIGIVSEHITLYQTDDLDFTERLKRFQCDAGLNSCLDAIYQFSNYKEKIELIRKENGIHGTWSNKSDKIDIEIYGDEFYPIARYEYLQFTIGDKTFNLKDLLGQIGNYEIVADNGRGTRIILEFEYVAKQGLSNDCMDDRERGFVYLEFTGEHELLDFKSYLFASCIKNLEFTNTNEAGSKIEYLYFDKNNMQNEILILDKSKVEIFKK